MKKSIIIIAGIVLFVIIMIAWISGMYNGLVNREEGTKQAWAQVENVYQRRSDLIPNLVETVKGYANFEKSTLTDVVNARAKATQVTVDPTKLTPAQIQNFQGAQNGLSSALGRLMVVMEKYPDLKANQNFLDLQAQLEGTENRIAVERKKFNEVVMDYNTAVRRFPRNIFAGMFGFQQKGYFQAEEGAAKAPKIKF
ncbi:MAG: LemA family protein [Bacteroidetes bacterium]|nr:LemA family protein [Bacteroidota bacterium]